MSRCPQRRPTISCSAYPGRIWCGGGRSFADPPDGLSVPVLDADAGRIAGDLAPVRVLRGHDALDGAEAVVEPAGELVEPVEQILVLRGQRRRALPSRDVVAAQPGKAEDAGRYAAGGTPDVLHCDQHSLFAYPL